jgi:hypothetical protein
MSFEEGRVIAVAEETAGSELATAASSSATSITVVDGLDFDADEGGQLTINGVVMAYTVDDEDAPAPLTVPALAGSHAVESPVLIYPPVVERFASVMTPDADEELVARVPHALYERLDVGTRDDEDAATPSPEVVLATLEDDEWVVSDVLDKSPESLQRGAVGEGRWELDNAGFRLYSPDDVLIIDMPTGDPGLFLFEDDGTVALSLTDAGVGMIPSDSAVPTASRSYGYIEPSTGDLAASGIYAYRASAWNHEVRAFSTPGFGTMAQIVLLDETGASEVARLSALGSGKVQIADGVAHGLGATPVSVLATCRNNAGTGTNRADDRMFATVGTKDGTNFSLTVRHEGGANVTAGQVDVMWLAVT